MSSYTSNSQDFSPEDKVRTGFPQVCLAELKLSIGEMAASDDQTSESCHIVPANATLVIDSFSSRYLKVKL